MRVLLEALGIGVSHEGPSPTFGSLSAALSAALKPGTRAYACAVAGTIRIDGAMIVAKLLVDAVVRKSPSRSG